MPRGIANVGWSAYVYDLYIPVPASPTVPIIYQKTQYKRRGRVRSVSAEIYEKHPLSSREILAVTACNINFTNPKPRLCGGLEGATGRITCCGEDSSYNRPFTRNLFSSSLKPTTCTTYPSLVVLQLQTHLLPGWLILSSSFQPSRLNKHGFTEDSGCLRTG